MLIAAPLLLAAACNAGIHDGGPGWLNLLIALFTWDALKFLVLGSVSLLRFTRIRLLERRFRARPAVESGRIEGAVTLPR